MPLSRTRAAPLLALVLLGTPSLHAESAAMSDAGAAGPAREATLSVRIFDWVEAGFTGARRLLTETKIPVREGKGLLRVSHGHRPNQKQGFELHLGAVDGEGATLELKNLGSTGAPPAQGPLRIGGERTFLRIAPGTDGYALEASTAEAGHTALPGTYEIELEPGAL